jgi:hypothetical protein
MNPVVMDLLRSIASSLSEIAEHLGALREHLAPAKPPAVEPPAHEEKKPAAKKDHK